MYFVKNTSVLLSSVEKILTVADLKVVKREVICLYLIFYIKKEMEKDFDLYGNGFNHLIM